MESLLIFIAIFVIDALIKRANAKKKALEEKQLHEDSDETENEEFDESEEPSLEQSPSANRKLQEYIKGRWNRPCRRPFPRTTIAWATR